METTASQTRDERDEDVTEIRLRGTGLPVLAHEWKSIASEVWRAMFEERIAMLAAAVAFYTFLSLPPALTLFVSVFGLVAEAGDVAATIDGYGPLLPDQAEEVLTGQLAAIASSPGPSLSIGILVSVLFGLWSSTRGIRALIVACNAIDGEGPPRGILALNRLALALTVGAMVFGLFALLLVVLLPALMALVEAPTVFGTLTTIARWPLLGGGMMVVLAVLYAYAPNRRRDRIHWATWGAATATLLWLLASGVMSAFVREFGRYNEIYGALASVVVLLVWLYLSAWAILLGAALNAALVRTRKRVARAGAGS